MSRSQVLARSLPSRSRIPVPCIAVAPRRRQNRNAPCQPLSVNMSDPVTHSPAYLLYIVIKHSNLRMHKKKKVRPSCLSVSHKRACFGSPVCVCVFSSNFVAELTNYSAFVYFAGADFHTRLNYSRTRRVWLFLPPLLFKKIQIFTSRQVQHNKLSSLAETLPIRDICGG